MSSQEDITPREALMRLGASTAEAIAQVLEMFVPGEVQRGEVTVLAETTSPFANVARGSIASSVSYVDGVTGANVFVLSPVGARTLAGAMGAAPPEDAEGARSQELSELEMSAIAEASNQTMAAAARAIGVVLGQEIQISSPDTRVLDNPASATDIYGSAPHAISTTFLIAGESCRLIQLVPAAFVVRMVRAMDDRSAQDSAAHASLGGAPGGGQGPDADAGPHSVGLEEALGGISLRVWAELGRARMPLGSALGLPIGAVLDLDRPAEAPVDLYVNGTRFGRGQLLVTEDGEWAVALETLETDALQLPDRGRPGSDRTRADVETGSQPLDPESDQPIETPASPTDTDTPDEQQAEVEGAVT